VLVAVACAGVAPPASGSKAAEATDVPPHETLMLDPRNGAVRFLRGEDLGAGLPGVAAGDAEAVARAFLAAYAALFRIADPAAELALQRVDRESSGAAHVRFAQRWKGLPLPEAELIVHLDAGGRVVLVNGSYVPTPRGVDTAPALSAADARRAAARASGVACADCATDLIVSAAAEEPRLAWRVAAPPGRIRGEEVWVDAQTGAVLRRLAAALPALAPGPAGKQAP
jgi:Zn-dependent metalloprotease